MRTTIDIPDELLKKAKRAALEQDLTLRDFVSRGLEMALGESVHAQSSRRIAFPLLELSADCPLRVMRAQDLAVIEAEDEARSLDAIYRRR
jgi:hypothetical protein